MKRTADRLNEIDRLIISSRFMAIVAFVASAATLAFVLYRAAGVVS